MNTLAWSSSAHRAHKAAISARASYTVKIEAQTEKMTTGPFLDDDGFTLVVPSEWYNEDAVTLWKSKGFEWRPKTSTWQRDTRKPLHGQTYTPMAWLTATRRRFYQFWPACRLPAQAGQTGPNLLEPRHTNLRTGKVERRRYTEWADRRRYVEGEYGEYIEH